MPSADSSSPRDRAVLRFAPSPTGALHLGSALSALLSYDAACRLDGRFLLRIENIDLGRCRREHEQALLKELAWLGLAWEQPVRRQSEHFDSYRDGLVTLNRHGLLYACTCTRSGIAGQVAERERTGVPWPRDPDGAPFYPGTCRPAHAASVDLDTVLGKGAALRLHMDRALACAGGEIAWRDIGDALFEPAPSESALSESAPSEPGCPPLPAPRTVVALPARWGDVVLARKETPTSYHLSVVMDDALQGITHVTRGMDLFEATAIHRLLQVLLDLPEPLYAHHRLLLGDDGRKLSKSLGDTGLKALREAGATPAQIRWRLGLPAAGTRARLR